VVDHLAKVGMNVQAMDVNLTTVDYKGKEADATVSIAPKGGNPAQGMSMKYHLEQQGAQWVVTGRQDSAGHGAGSMPGMSPQGGGTAPGTENPHGAAPATGGSGKMPSPQDLPPSKK
jgi:hypothetical protein